MNKKIKNEEEEEEQREERLFPRQKERLSVVVSVVRVLLFIGKSM